MPTKSQISFLAPIEAPAGNDITIRGGDGAGTAAEVIVGKATDPDVELNPGTGGRFTVGSSIAITPEKMCFFNQTIEEENGHFDVTPTESGAQASNRYGIRALYTIDTSNSHAWANGAILGQTVTEASNARNYTNRQSGLYGYVNHGGTGTLSDVRGVYSTYTLAGNGIISNFYGVYAFGGKSGGGSVTNYYGFYLADMSSSGLPGTVYGLFVAPQPGTTLYPIWSVQPNTVTNMLGGNSIFGDGTTAADVTDVGTGTNTISNGQFAVTLGTTYGGGWSIFIGKHARGTKSSPTATLQNNPLVALEGRGYGASAFGSASTGAFRFRAAENFTNTAQGTYASIYTTPTGSTTAAEVVRISESGALSTTGGLSVVGATKAYKSFNYVTSAGSNNAITVTLTDALGANITQAAGLEINILLGNSLQIGANTLALNGATALAIKSSRNPANNIAVAYVAGATIRVMFDGTRYVDMSQ
jgi:hypothetical protein